MNCFLFDSFGVKIVTFSMILARKLLLLVSTYFGEKIVTFTNILEMKL